MASRILARIFDYLVCVEGDHGMHLQEQRHVYVSGLMSRRTTVPMR